MKICSAQERRNSASEGPLFIWLPINLHCCGAGHFHITWKYNRCWRSEGRASSTCTATICRRQFILQLHLQKTLNSTVLPSSLFFTNTDPPSGHSSPEGWKKHTLNQTFTFWWENFICDQSLQDSLVNWTIHFSISKQAE